MYFSLEIEEIRSLSLIEYDLYLCLSKEKYIRVIRGRSPHFESEIDKLVSKGVFTLYLTFQDAENFFDQKKLSAPVDRFAGEEDDGPTQVVVNEIIQDSVKVMGVTPEVQEMVRQSVEAAIKKVRDTDELANLLSGFKKGPYMSGHSTVLAHIGGYVLSKLSWANEEDIQNLALAAILHDATVESDELARLNNLVQVKAQGGEVSDEKLQEYLHHPATAAEVVKVFTGADVPTEVEMMVYQHHEHPNGTGFPNGVSCNAISLHSAAFIICHELADLFCRKWINFHLPFLLKALKKKYVGGHFTQILEELEAKILAEQRAKMGEEDDEFLSEGEDEGLSESEERG